MVVFSSFASNLVTGDSNDVQDVYVHDRDSGVIERVSLSSSGAEGNGASNEASISDDGRYVCFTSTATNLVAGDTNGLRDVFLRDRDISETYRLSEAPGGLDGNGTSTGGRISGNGGFVAFETFASNLIGNDTNGVKDIYVRNINSALTYRVSVGFLGAQLVEESRNASISENGNIIVFQTDAPIAEGDDNFDSDVYLRNHMLGTTERVSVGPQGQQSDGFANFPDISADGNLVVFSSRSTTFGPVTAQTRVFVRNMSSGAIEHVSLSANGNDGGGNSDGPTISADGRYVGFSSTASNLVAGDNNGVDDLFVRDRTAGTTIRANVSSTGAQSSATNFTYFAVPFYVATDGTFAFHSSATDLVPGDSNEFTDVFTGVVPEFTAPPVADNSALIAKYKAEIKKLTKQIKAAKKKKKATVVKKLTAKLKKVQKLLSAL